MGNKPDRMTFQTNYGRMIRTLREEIYNSTWKQGDYLPSELTLAEQYGLSKKSVRRALEQLVEEGLIGKVPRVGSQVLGLAQSKATTIRVGYYPSLEGHAAYHELIQRFQQAYPYIKVESVLLPYRQYIETVSGYCENSWLDVIAINNWNFQEIVERGALDLFEPQAPDENHYSFLHPTFSYEGSLYAQPFIFSPVILCYNKSMFQSLQIPEPDSSWSWNKLSQVAIQLKNEWKTFGFYAHISSANRFPIMLLQQDFKFQNSGGKYLYEDDRLWEGLALLRDLIYTQGLFPSFLSESDADVEKLFAAGQTAMILTTYYGLNEMKDASIDYDIAPIPYKNKAATLLLSTGLAINRQSEKKEAAKLLVAYLCAEPAQSYIHQHTLSIPAHKAAAESDDVTIGAVRHPSRYYIYREIAPTYQSYRDLGITIEALEQLQSNLKLFWSNLESPKSIAKRLTEKN